MARALHLPGGDHRLCRRLARARAAVLDRVPLGGDRCAGHARALAVPDHSLAAVLARLWPTRSPAPGMSSGVLDTRQAFARLSPSVLFNEVVAVVLDPSVRSTQQSMLAAMGLALIERGAIPDAPIPLRAERADRVAADRRPGGRHDPAVRDRLHRVPAAGSAGLERLTHPLGGQHKKKRGRRVRPRSCDQLISGQTWITATILYSSSTMMISSL